MVSAHPALGKFSLYFVVGATIFVLGIFAYALIRLFKLCQSRRETDLFERADKYD